MTAPLAAAPWARVAFVLAALYALGAVLWYGATPLGRVPVLDGREVLDLARAIADGSVPREPFYRAPVYSALLAVPAYFGAGADALPWLARALNLAAHFASAWLVAALARRIGAGPHAAAAAALAWIVYPVALHFAGDPLDISLAIALLLGGTVLALDALDALGARDWRGAAAAGALLALATLARPNFLTFGAAWGAVLALDALRRRDVRVLLAFAGSAAVLLAAMGCANLAVGGSFRVLPWQGAYALWAANRPESNGRFYTQVVQVRDVARNENPARLESELLYRRETGATGPLDVDAMTAHWRARFVGRLRAEPAAVLGGIARRARWLVHDAEQYDNKTYSFQKEASPWLRWNPLGFGVVLTLAAAALAATRATTARNALLFATAAYAAGAALFFASDRFRLPIAALLLPVAAVALGAGRERLRRPVVLAAVALTLAVAYWPVPREEREATWTEDLLLGAQAAADVGDAPDSERLARRALAREPWRSMGWELVCNARYNQLFAALPAAPPDAAWQAEAHAACTHRAVLASQSRALGAVFAWRAGERDQARATWQRLLAERGPGAPWAEAFLVAIGDVPVVPRASTDGGLTLALARVLRGDTALRARLVAAYGSAPVELELARLRALLLLAD